MFAMLVGLTPEKYSDMLSSWLKKFNIVKFSPAHELCIRLAQNGSYGIKDSRLGGDLGFILFFEDLLFKNK